MLNVLCNFRNFDFCKVKMKSHRVYLSSLNEIMCICCRNRSAENLYGYTASEALGQDVIELLSDVRDFGVASNIVHRVATGESWTGQFPVKDKRGNRFLAVATNTPFYDDDGALVGIVCVSSDSRPFREAKVAISELKDLGTYSSFRQPRITVTGKLGLDHLQPLPVQTAIKSKISNFVCI